MERKRFFLRTLLLLALCVPWTTQAQTAKVSEYDYSVDTAQAYTSIVATGTAWSATDATAGYTSFTMPFAIYLGESQIPQGTTVYVSRNGYVSTTQPVGTTTPADIIAPLYQSSGFTDGSVYTKVDASSVIVEWRKVKSGSNIYSFQLKVLPNGNIKFCYGPMTINTAIYPFVGMSTSTTDVFAATGYDWNTITRALSQTSTRTLSTTYHPAFNPYTAKGIIYTFTQPACVKPTALTVGTITASTAALSWTSDGTSFEVKYSTDANFNPVTEGTLITANATSVTLTGLTPTTTYYACVRKVCSATSNSGWTAPVSFTPGLFSMASGSNSLTLCGGIIYDDGGATGNYSDSFTGTLTLYPATPNSLLTLTGSYNTESGWDKISIYSGVGTTGTALVNEVSGTGTINVTSEDFTTGALTLYFHSDGSGTYAGFGLTASCSPIPTCFRPTNLTCTENSMGVSVAWTDNNTVTPSQGWQIKYGPTGFDPTTEAGTLVSAATNPYTLTTLTSGVTQDIYVRSACNSTDQSDWSTAVTITPGTYNMATSGIDTLRTCNAIIYDNGGPTGSYSSNVNSTLIIYPSTPNSLLTLTGSYTTESNYDKITIYSGVGTTGTALVNQVSGTGTINVTSEDFTTGALTLYFYSDGSTNSSGFELTSSCQVIPTCTKPTAITATSITVSSASISLTDANTTPYGWMVKYLGADNVEHTVFSTINPVSLTGLNGNEGYQVYGRVVCTTTDTSEWSDPITFRTSCGTIQNVPYYEDFSTYPASSSAYSYYSTNALPSCWNILSSGTNTASTTGSNYFPRVYKYSYTSSFGTPTVSNNFLCLGGTNSSSYAATRGQYKYAILPEMSTDLSYVILSFKANMSSSYASDGTLSVGYVIGTDTTFTRFVDYTSTTTPFTAQLILSNYLTSTPTGARLAFRWKVNSTSTYYCGIDDIAVTMAPSCFPPSALTSVSQTKETATVAWQENSRVPATQWEVKYGLTGFDVATEGTSLVVNTNPATISGLTAGTNYDFYVRALCSATDNSDWSNAGHFSTLIDCGNEFTYVDANTGNLTTTDNYVPVYNNYGSSYSQSIYTVDELNEKGIYAGYIHRVGIKWTSNAAYAKNTTIYLGTTNKTGFASTAASEWVPAANLTEVYAQASEQHTAGLTIYELTTPYYWDGTSNLVFAYMSNHNGTNPGSATGGAYATNYSGEYRSMYARKDNAIYTPVTATTSTAYGVGYNRTDLQFIACSDVPTCFKPKNLVSSNITAVSATFGWSDTVAHAWSVRYAPASIFNADDPRSYTETNVTDTTLTVQGLQHSTKYVFQVRANCAADDYSDWTASSIFYTGCGVMDYDRMPIAENFDGVTGNIGTALTSHVLPLCWNFLNVGTFYQGYPSVYASSTYSYSGTNSIRFYTGSTATFADQYAIMPAISSNVPMDTLDISFFARRSSTTAAVTVGVMSDPQDSTTFVPIETIDIPTTNYAQQTIRLTNYTGTGRYIAFKAAKPATDFNGFYLDDIKVEPHVIVNVIHAADNQTHAICNEIVMMDTINGSVVNNANATWVITPATEGKVVNLTGSMDCEYGYDFLAIYEGVGTTGTRLYYGTGTDEGIDIISPNNVGPLTVQFISDGDGSDYAGFRLRANCVCPPSIPSITIDTTACGVYTWKNGRVYTNTTNISVATTQTWSNTYAALNVAGCTDTNYTLALTLHPTYSFPVENHNVCAGSSLMVHGRAYTETGLYADTLQSMYGCDSIFHVNITKRALPTVAIHVNGAAATTTTACNLNNLTLRARGAATTAFTYVWDDASTNEYRTVQPVNGSTYTVRTINAYGCESTPATLVVNTVASPVVSLVAANPTLCAGEATTLTATANDAWTYAWTNTTGATSQVSVTPAATTTYTVTATSTDAMHCYGSAQVTVNVNALPVATIAATPATLCQGASTTVTVNTEATGASYRWNNATTAASLTDSPMASTNYTVTVIDANNCHKDFTARVVVNRVYDTTDEVVTCAMQLPYVWTFENSLTAAGTYTHSFTSSKGCDSTVTLTLTVQDTAIHNSAASYCFGDGFIFGSNNYTASTSQTYRYLATENGCPNKYNLAVTVHQQNATTQTEVVCDSMRWNGNLYTATGNYVDTLQNRYHCDSVATLALTVNPTKYVEETIAAVCDSMVWNGISYKAVGDYTQTLHTVAGCDSIVTRHLLAINHAQYDVANFVTCERTFTWGDGTTTGNGVTYAYSETDGNIVWQKGTTAEGCPLYDVLNLTIKPAPDTTAVTATACDNYIVNVVDCDGTPGTQQYTATGEYNYRTVDENGNAVIIHLNLTINHSNYTTTRVSVCENTPYAYAWTVNGSVIGTYNTSQLISNAVPNTTTGCSDIAVLDLTVLHNDTVTRVVSAPICYTNYYSYMNNGNFYMIDLSSHSTDTVQVRDTFYVAQTAGAATNGCAKVDQLALTINPVIGVGTYEPIAVCEGTTTIPNWHGITLDIAGLASGQYVKNIPNTTTTCNHYYGYALTVNTPTYAVENITANYEYTWRDGVTYQASNNTATYTVNDVDVNGCDSIYLLNLTLRDTVINHENIEGCNQVVFGGTVYRNDTVLRVNYGPITDTLSINEGLDSVVYYNIDVRTTQFIDQYVTASGSYTWPTSIDGNGQTYTTSIDPVYNRLAGVCPDVMVLHLTMVPLTQICTDQLPYTSAAGNVITSAMVGTHTYEYVSSTSPYTLEVLTLKVNPAFNRTLDACPYELPLTYRGTTLTAANAANVTDIRFNSTTGCDSVLKVTLNVGVQPTNTYTDVMCGAGATAYTYAGYGFVKNSGIVAGLNSFTQRVAAPSGCDSSTTLNLTVDMPVNNDVDTVSCYTYTAVDGTIRTNTTNAPITFNDTAVTVGTGNTCNDTTFYHVTLNPRSIYDTTIISNTGILNYNGTQYTAISATEPYIHNFAPVIVDTNSYGCDSLINVTIKVGHPVITALNQVSCGSYTWVYGNDTTVLTATGTYQATIPSVEGFDSTMILNLTVNPQVHTTDAITFPVSQGTLTYGGSAFNYSGYLADTTETYTFNFGPSTTYCDSIVDLTVNVVYDYRFDTATICNSQNTYNWVIDATHTRVITITTPIDYDHTQQFDYVETLNAGTPTEWVYNLHLVRSPFKYGTENIAACKAYTWSNGVTYTASTSLPVRRTASVAGCDSIVTLNLTITPATKTDQQVACDTYTWNRNGQTYTATTYTATIPSTTTYYDAASTTDVCDTVYTLNLIVNNHKEVTLPAVTNCYSYTWDRTSYGTNNVISSTYTTSGVYKDTVLAMNGCDSILTLPLTINPLVETTVNAAATYSYTWNVADFDGSNPQTHTYTTSGTYKDTVLAATGCNNVITLNLTVYQPTYTDTNVVICDLPGQAYTWNRTGRTVNGVINDPTAVADTAVIARNVIGGDSTIMRLHIIYGSTTYDIDRNMICNGQTFTWVRNGETVGNYTTNTNTATYVSNNVVGCDSIVYLNLTVRPVYSTTSTLNICESAMPYTYTSADSTMSHVFAAAGSYTFENNSVYGCDSNYTVVINVIPTVYDTITDDFCVGTYNFNAYVPAGYYNTHISGGDVYSFYFPTSAVQGSGDYTQTAHKAHSVATGCDVYTTLNLTINAPTYDNITKVSCLPYVWNLEGVNVGSYSNDTVVTALATNPDVNGCNHFVTLNFRRDAYNETTQNIAACVSYTTPKGQVCTTSGIYTDTIIGQDGACDSYIHYNVTINTPTQTATAVTACDSYTWNGRTYDVTGDYIYGTTNAFGCAQTDTLHLTINNSTTAAEDVTACDSYTWAKNNTLYAVSGEYIAASTNAAGCAQTDTLHLTINHSTSNTVVTTACDSYTWDVTGETYTTSGVRSHTSTNAAGCNYVQNLNLTVNQSTTTSESAQACNSYTWNGTTYTTSGTYVDTLTNVAGCNNIATLNLTVYTSATSQTTASACGSYTWNGTTYNQSGTYTHSFAGPLAGCDSVATLVLTVNHSTASVAAATACASYTWNGVAYTHSGIYYDTLQNVNGCDSLMTLALTISAPVTSDIYQTACNNYSWLGSTYSNSGNYSHTYTDANNCDSIVTLHLTINHSTTGTVNILACDSYTWVNGITYTASTNTPTYTYTNAANCDSVVTLHLTVNQSTNTTTTMTVCESYTWHGMVYTASTMGATYNYLNAAGCPSTETLNLTVNHGTHNVTTATACDSYTWHGTAYTASTNNAVYQYTNAANCSSVDTLHLTVNHSTSSTATATACDTYTWINGQTYTATTATPTYTFHNGNAHGCDSTVTLHLTVNHSTSSIATVVACDSYEWIDGNTYAASISTATYHTTNAANCDSTITLHLTVNYSTTGSQSVTACDSYTWQGNAYTTSGVHTANLTNAAGCDSVATLNLTINYSTTGSVSAQASGSYTWNGNTYSSTGNYTVTLTNAAGCDSVVTLHLVLTNLPLPQIVSYNDRVLMINHYPNGEGTEIVNYAGYQWYKDGVAINSSSSDSYAEDNNALLNGCYYVKVPAFAGSTDSLVSNTLCFEHTGITDVTADVTITVSPNPVISGNRVRIETSLDETQLQGATLMIYDLRGRVVLSQPMEDSTVVVRVEQASGAYMIRITTKSGDTYVKKLIVK